jgi:hypothetical protein
VTRHPLEIDHVIALSSLVVAGAMKIFVNARLANMQMSKPSRVISFGLDPVISSAGQD